MKKLVSLLLITGVYFGITSAQAVLVEKVNAQPGKLIVPYERYKLPNGLTLLISEDHSDPVVHLNITYHVGSAREVPGKSGFAHFFEHMLFQGSKHVADEEHFKIIKQYGGDVNGNTTRDRTAYIETFPSNFTETALWMEADRMGFLLEAFTQKKFEVQRATVKNEKDQNYTNPYGFVQEVKDQNLYPEDHPYSWSTIGFVDDLNRADSSDLRNFFLRWYGPNNACITIAGDVNPADVVKWVEKYFGGIAPCPEVKKQRVKPVQLTDNKVKTYTDPNAYVPLIYTTWPSVPTGHEDEAALDVLSYLLSGGRNSQLYKKFTEPEFALFATTTNNPLSQINHELAGEFALQIYGYPWSNIPELQRMAREVIDSFEIIGFSEEDFTIAINNILSQYPRGLEQADSKAYFLSTAWYLFDLKNADGTSMNLEDDASRYRKLTKEDILRVFRKYIKGKFSSTVIIEPPREGTTDEEKKALKYVSYNPNADYHNPVAEAEYKNLSPKPVVDNFDRTVQPKSSPAKPAIVPTIYRKKMANNLEVLGTDFRETPMVNLVISIEGGNLVEGTKEVPYGIASFTANIMNNGTALKTPLQLEKELEKIGASISFGSGGAFTRISLNSPSDKIDAALAILDEMLFKPRWDEKEFKKDKSRTIENVKSSLLSRGTGAFNAYRKLMFGETPLGHFTSASDVSSISLSDCKNYYEKYYAPNVSKVVVVGPYTADEMYTKLAFLEKWQTKTVDIPKPMTYPKFNTTQVFGVEYIDAEQSDIYVAFKSLPYDYNGDYFKSTIMNFALGGNFNSRLNLNIREDKGWTYGIRGGFGSNYKDIPGNYSISAGIRASATDSAIVEIIRELEKYKTGGITQEEFDFTKSALLASDALSYESMFQKTNFLLGIAIRDLPENYPTQQADLLKAMTIEGINVLASTQLKTDELIIIVAGDKLLLQDKLNNLGYGKVQWLDKSGSGNYKVYKATKKPKDDKHEKNYK